MRLAVEEGGRRYPPGSKHLTMLDVHRWLSERDVTIRVLSKQKERTLSGEGDGGLKDE